MKQIVISTLTLLWVVFSNSVAQAGALQLPAHYYSEDGKVVCEVADGEQWDKCNESDYFIQVSKANVSLLNQARRYDELADQFVKEAAAQLKLHRAMTAQQYYEKLKESRVQGKSCEFRGILSCELAEMEKELRTLVEPPQGEEGRYWRLKYGYYWRLKDGDFAQTEVQTPLQSERFGPYGQKTQRRLQSLVDEFNVECFSQQMQDSSQGVDLLKIALKASSVMVGNMPSGKRQRLFDEWHKQCAKKGEKAADVTIRFLLSRKARGSVAFYYHRLSYYDSKDAWHCHVWSDPLRSVDQCGAVRYWYSEGRKVDITPQFRGAVSTLKEARQKR